MIFAYLKAFLKLNELLFYQLCSEGQGIFYLLGSINMHLNPNIHFFVLCCEWLDFSESQVKPCVKVSH